MVRFLLPDYVAALCSLYLCGNDRSPTNSRLRRQPPRSMHSRTNIPTACLWPDYAVTHTISWGGLNDEGLIFGKIMPAAAVDYTLRAPSGCGSSYTGSGDSGTRHAQKQQMGHDAEQEQRIYQNWNKMYSLGDRMLLLRRVVPGVPWG